MLLLCLLLAWMPAVAAPPSSGDFVCAGVAPLEQRPGAAAKLASIRVPLKDRESLHVLVVFAEFGDEVSLSPAPPAYAGDLFNPELPGSLTHFYRSMSEGRFSLSGTVLPRRYASEQPAGAYLAPEPGVLGNFGRFVREILSQVDQDLDFAQFDNDGPDGVPNSGDDDGMVDYIFVDVRRVPRGFLLGGATGIVSLGLDGPYVTRDLGAGGKPIRVGSTRLRGALSEEGTFAQTVGVMAHEFGHSLGLPDLFDTEHLDPAGDSAGIGRWGLMGWGALGWHGDDGPNPFCAWSLEKLGWIGRGNERLTEVEEDGPFTVRPLRRGGQVYRIELPVRTLSTSSSGLPEEGSRYNFDEEYLLLEERTRAGSYYDRNLPGEGLLVWHVRQRRSGNQDESAKAVDLLSADGLYADAGFPRGRVAAAESGSDNLDFWAHDPEYSRAHAGNLGDGTDPFDGTRFTRLDFESNPSIGLGGLFPEASTDLSLQMRRQGEDMRVELRLPRWAGIIRGEVHWAGAVRVDGDVRVAPGGRLLLHRGLQVRFAGGDRLRSGLDPEHSELEVQGDFLILPGEVRRQKVLFAAQKPGESWYGIRLDPERAGRIHLPRGQFELRDATQGIVLPGAPPGAQGQVRSRVRLVDEAGLETAGNGDGRLNPGETVQLVVEVSNWRLVSLDKVSVDLSWAARQPLVPQQREDAQKRNFFEPFEGSIFPGQTRVLRLPAVVVQPGAEAGQRVEFSVGVKVGSERNLRSKQSFVVEGSYPEHSVEFSLPEGRTRGGAVLLPSQHQSLLEVRAGGQVESVDLVLRSLPDSKPAGAALPTMTRRRGVFAARLPALEPGLYEVVPRIRSPGGAVVFSEHTLPLWVTPAPRRAPALVFAGKSYTGAQRRNLGALLGEILAGLGRQVQLVEAAPADDFLYRTFLEAYPEGEGLVLWLGERLEDGAQSAFREFLQRGGDLFVLSDNLHRSPRIGNFLQEMLHASKVDERKFRRTQMRSLNLDALLRFATREVWMDLAPGAEPMLFDHRFRPGGLRLDTGTYRVVYFPFGLNSVPEETWSHLLEAGLRFLEGKTPAAQLEVVGHPAPGGALALEETGPLPVRVRVEGEAAAAELLVHTIPELTSLAVLPMRAAAGGFETSFAPPGPGRYYLSVRLRRAGEEARFSTAHLQLMQMPLEQPVLVLVGDQYGTARKSALRQGFARMLETLDSGAAFVDLLESDSPFYASLFAQYLDPGEAVVWLGREMDLVAREAFRRFEAEGGRLLVASQELRTSEQTREFRREVLHVEKTRARVNGRVHGIGARLEALEWSVRYTPFSLRAPAVPLLSDEAGRIAGLRLEEEGHRLVFLPFDLPTGETRLQPLLFATLPFLLQGAEHEVKLEVPGREILDHTLVLRPGERVPVRAQVGGAVAGTDLVLLNAASMELLSSAPMEPVGQDGARRFEGLVPALEPGQYVLLVRLRDTQGRPALSAASLDVVAVPFGQPRPVLLFVDPDIASSARQGLLADLEVGLGELGLEANTLALAPSDAGVYRFFLERFVDPQALVLWLGADLSPEAQAVFQRFAVGGGRLLMASRTLARSPGAGEFLRDLFHIEGTRPEVRGLFRNSAGARRATFIMRYVPLEIGAQALPIVRDSEEEVAGVRFGAGARRGVFLSFDLHRMRPERRRQVISSALLFLRAPSTLRIEQVRAPAPVVAQRSLAPQLLLNNAGERPSEPFRVGYQILRGGELLFSAAQDEAPLPPSAQRLVRLPAWTPAREEGLQIRLGLSTSGEEALDYLPLRSLEVVDAPAPFRAVELPASTSAGNGAGFFDYDNDGDLDLYLVRRGPANRLYRNEGESWLEVAAQAGVADAGRGRGLAFGDFDGDGDLDLYLVNEEANRFLRNEGGGRFAEGRAGEALADAGSGRSAGFFDYDNDGDLDLYLVNALGLNRLFANEAALFVERSAEAGLADAGDGRGLALGDYDSDGDVDLFVSNTSGQSRLYRNEGGHFGDVHAALGLALEGGEVAADFGDYDNDGDADLFVSNELGANRLYRNEGGRSFVAAVLDLGGRSVGTAFLDYDNDGDLDLATTGVDGEAGGDQLYHNRGGVLVAAGSLLGLSSESVGRGLALGDYDSDGDLDLAVADNQGSRLYRNEVSSRRWLVVELVGVGANRHGVGARVEVWTPGRRQVRELQSGYGYASQTQPLVHFGLGAAPRVDSVRVLWPDGSQSRRTGVGMNRRLVLSHPGRVTAVEETAPVRPREFVLEPNFPNPFNAQTVIRYRLPRALEVELSIYNILGQAVRRLVRGPQPAGAYQVVWDGRDEQARPLGSGVYFYRLEAGAFGQTRRLLLLK